MLESKDRNNLEIKISDFGFSCFFDPKEGLDLVLGSPLYMAPEMFETNRYTSKIDIWSLGIVSYEILKEKHPFEANNLCQDKNLPKSLKRKRNLSFQN